jgi:hypothetical protein
MLLGGPQNNIKSHLVFTALFCFAPFSVFSSRMSAPHLAPVPFLYPFRLLLYDLSNTVKDFSYNYQVMQ